jgi:hypothetical protein
MRIEYVSTEYAESLYGRLGRQDQLPAKTAD